MVEEAKVEFDIAAFEREISNIELIDVVTITEAIVIWSEENNVELDLISAIIKKNGSLKLRVEEDARKRNLLKR